MADDTTLDADKVNPLALQVEKALRMERHSTHQETRYWCREYRRLLLKAIEAYETPIQQFRKLLIEFQTVTVSRSDDDAAEVQVIQQTLNVVLAEFNAAFGDPRT